MFKEKKNYYEVLEINPEVSMQAVHDAYNKARHAYSGDSVAMYSLMSPQECSAILGQIEDAYTVLGNVEKRNEYDKVRGFNETKEKESKDIADADFYKKDLSDLTQETTSKAAADKYVDVEREKHFKYKEIKDTKDEITVTKIQAINRFALDFKSNPEMEQKIDNCAEFTGVFLKEIREYKDVTVERLADMTRISKTYIRNIEADELDKLPAPAYTRGFIFQYAKCLKLNPDHVASSYIEYFKQNKIQ